MNRKGLAIVILVVVILLLLFSGKGSTFTAGSPVGGMNVASIRTGPVVNHVSDMAPVGTMGDNIGQTVSSASLIPRDVVATEDFGQFSPDKILGNQNYLDPRSQIGYPETLGGVLRNANQQERSEPLNPRNPVSIFNLSTIPPDTMRPKFEIDYEYH